MGFIEVRAGSGAFITRTDFDNNQAFNELSQKLSDNHKFSIQEIRQRFEARLIIEPDLAALAAERRSKKSLSVMSEAISGLEIKVKSADFFNAVVLDAEFHKFIALASDNKTLIAIMEIILRDLFEGWRYTFKTPIRMSTNYDEHKRILKAIESRNATEAKAAMRKHLENALERNMGSL
jgi:GntR family transcriptional repressor for pyruvate dehydrogenase complex